jgi:flagellar hook-associated protein 1 FlgK
MGTFDGLSIGLSALHAQRRAIEVAGQNVANVNTEGYTRQRVGMVADSGPVHGGIFSRYEGSGMGVRSVDILRLRDQFLEARAQGEQATGSYLHRMQTTMDRIELAVGEPSDNGIGAQLSDFWAGWDDVGLNPGDPAARAQLVERASTLAASFRQLDGALADLGTASLDQLSAKVDDVNGIAARIAELNGSIRSAQQAGLSANELADQRDLFVLQLAKDVGATARVGQDGGVDVYVGAMALVRGTTTEALAVDAGSGPGTARVVWADDGLTASVGGEGRALLETMNATVPGQRAALAAVAQQLHDDVNAIHATGFDLDGNPGGDFFTMGPGGIEVAAPVVADGRKVAASATAGSLDGSVAQQLAGQTGPDTAYRQLVVRLGVSAQAVNRRVEVQDSIVQQVDEARESEAGVNIDEEMTNLVSFQHAYSAAARFITVVDQMVETIIGMA